MQKTLICCVVLMISTTLATKLNYPRVLLPIFDKININFTLEVIEQGCFKWDTSRYDLIQIKPVYDTFDGDCSYKAVVTVLTREKRRNTAIVLAEDIRTGDTLRCDVILDVIDQLGVLTTTRELFLEEAPETFELWAQDSQGNAFTTLEGVEFNWVISSDGDYGKDHSWQQVLRFLTFTESPYHEVPKTLEKFEAMGLKGYMVLLEGKNTGSAKVSVKLPYSEYSNIVSPIEVSITILANIILDPTDAHILADDTVDFRILQLKQGKLHEISLNNQYYLEIEDESIAELSGKSATGLRMGRTVVVLRDRNVPADRGFDSEGNAFSSPSPRATITVTTASKITINLLPHYNWVTIEGEKHEIAIDLYTHDDQKIRLGPRYKVQSSFQESLFYVLYKSKNGSRIYGEAVMEGVTPVTGSFEKLSAKAELQIYKELTLTPTRVVLPFDSNNPRKQKIKFVAVGGDESYTWSSQNSKLVYISQNGVAETRVDSYADVPTEYLLDESNNIVIRHTTVRVALARNTKISRTAEIHFLPPVKLSIRKYNFETALNDYVKIHLSVYSFVNGSYVPFTNCDNLNFDLEFSSQIFQLDMKREAVADDELAKEACHILYLKGTSLGTTHLKISYKFMDKILSDEATLVVFEKLNILNPVTNEIVLPIGASTNLIYMNGPQKLFSIEAELQSRIDYSREIIELAKIETETSASMLVFNVLCRQVGESTLDLELFNSIPHASFVPYLSRHLTNVYCVKPRFINLYTTEILRQSCPIEMKNSLMHVKNRAENLEIQIDVLDARNRKLMNITSLVIEWLFARGNENYHSSGLHYRQTEEEFINDIRVPGRDFLVTAIGDVSTSFKVKAMVTKYDMAVLNSFGIVPEKPHFGIEKTKGSGLVQPIIENEIKFMAVNSTLLDRDTLSIFLGRNRPERVKIAQGSGFYEIKLTDQDIVTVELDPKTRELIIVPQQIGIVDLELVDRCLMTEAAHLTISVVSIGSIAVIMPDRVEKGKSIEAIIRIYDSNELLMNIDSSSLQIYELHENIFNMAIVALRLGDQSNLGLGEIRYHINGLELGETKIIFNSGYGDRAISSEPANIQVFPPLRLLPRNSSLLVGSSLQIYSYGGPHPDISIVYSVENHNVVSMDSAVVLARKLGTTTVTGRCVGVNLIDGTQIIFSEDTIDVTVVPLDKIQVRTPLVRIKTGATMPAFVWGGPDISPMILGTIDSIRVIWSTNQPDVVDIFGIFADAGIEYMDNDLISVRVRALNPGKAKIQATVILPGGNRLSSSVEVVVFKMLEVETPKHINQDAILIPPRSTIQLKANIDDARYKLSSDSNGIVKVTPDGNVKSGDTLGRDTIIAKTFDQTLPIDVEVKNIQYILATLLYPSVKLRQTEQKIPSGMNMILKISLHDNLGNEFSHNIEDVNGIKYDLSHKDMVDVQIGNNLTAAVNLPRETITMIAISLKDSTGVKHSEDFVKVSVAESKHIFPTKTVFSVGDIICFDSPLTSTTFWTSSDDRIVSIDRSTGVARVLNNRFKLGEKIAITNGDKSGSFLKYDIEVREADKIEFFKSFDIFSGNSYRGHLVLRNHQQVDKFSNLLARNISKCVNFIDKVPIKFFTCKIISKDQLGAQVIENLKVSPQFDKILGTYACEIELITNQLDIVSIVKSNEINIELEAQLSNGISDVVTLKIVPAIKVTPDTIPVDQITQQGIVITGLDKVLQKVEVKPSDTSVLEVVLQAKVHGSLQYKVRLLDELPSDEQLFVQIHSPLTLQDIQIPILEPNSIAKCSMQPFNNTSILLINIISNIGVIISIIVAVLSCYVWFFCSTQRKAEVNDDAFAKSYKSPSSSIMNISGSPQVTPRGPSYPISPYFGSQSSGSQNISTGNESPVYGDTILISPQKRINRRYL